MTLGSVTTNPWSDQCTPIGAALLIVISLVIHVAGCGNRAASPGSYANQLTVPKVQAAVNQAADWTRKGGSVTVTGIQELPAQNEARADLQFNNFQYNASGFTNEPAAQNETTPTGNPAVDYIPPSAERHVASYSGNGSATIKHYTDGRWVLTAVSFEFHGLTTNIPVQ